MTLGGRRDRGSAAVWVLGLIAVLALGVTMAATQTVATVAHRRAESAADLTAISAAQGLADLSGQPCAAAAEVATANGVRLEHCVVEGTTVTVVVALTLHLPSMLGGSRMVTATSKAGR
jgi:secretion/DNA translocation related TadE-like protein